MRKLLPSRDRLREALVGSLRIGAACKNGGAGGTPEIRRNYNTGYGTGYERGGVSRPASIHAGFQPLLHFNV